MFSFFKKIFNVLFFRNKLFNTIYVGNLVYSATAADLRAMFSKFGYIVNTRVIKNVRTNRSKGYGFVTFKDHIDAKSALVMEGKSIKGRPIRVRFAHSKPLDYDNYDR